MQAESPALMWQERPGFSRDIERTLYHVARDAGLSGCPGGFSEGVGSRIIAILTTQAQSAFRATRSEDFYSHFADGFSARMDLTKE